MCSIDIIGRYLRVSVTPHMLAAGGYLWLFLQLVDHVQIIFVFNRKTHIFFKPSSDSIAGFAVRVVLGGARREIYNQ